MITEQEEREDILNELKELNDRIERLKKFLGVYLMPSDDYAIEQFKRYLEEI